MTRVLHDWAPGLREAAKICRTCHGMSWRVEGIRCSSCKLMYAPEPPVALDVTAKKAVTWL